MIAFEKKCLEINWNKRPVNEKDEDAIWKKNTSLEFGVQL
jgi:hypothetical protein